MTNNGHRALIGRRDPTPILTRPCRTEREWNDEVRSDEFEQQVRDDSQLFKRLSIGQAALQLGSRLRLARGRAATGSGFLRFKQQSSRFLRSCAIHHLTAVPVIIIEILLLPGLSSVCALRLCMCPLFDVVLRPR